MKILLLASEVVPYAKTGGLADVAGALPHALAEQGVDVRVALPQYKRIPHEASSVPIIQATDVLSDSTDVYAEGVIATHDPKVIFVRNDDYYGRDNLYGYPDDADRFIYFARAVLSLLRPMDFRPDVIHLNDWQCGLVPVYLRTQLADDPFYSGIGTLFTIHNLAYQGVSPAYVMDNARLDWSLFNYRQLEFYGQLSFMKGGLVFSDLLNTVSPTYAQEIQTPEYGEKLEGVLQERSADLHGILNGVDYDVWNPETDEALPVQFSASGGLSRRSKNVSALRKECGFAATSKGPLIGLISRLSAQKGLDLVLEAAQDLVKLGAHLVILGTGDPELMAQFEELGKHYPKRVKIFLKFDDALARRIYAGSHFFLMPSLYEPCGLGQMIALRYGSLPIVRATGGLQDTVRDADDHPEGNGIVFEEPTAQALVGAVERAVRLHKDEARYRELQQRAMACDHSWHHSAREYIKLYKQAQERAKARAGGE